MSGNGRAVLLLVAAIVVVALIVGSGPDGEGPPLDPRSVGPRGALGLVETLERLGADVELDDPVPSERATTALLLQDRLDEDDQAGLDRWVRDGGTLVVADLSNDLAARRDVSAAGSDRRDVCTIDALAAAERITSFPTAFPTAGVDHCFGDGDTATIVSRRVGDGRVVTIGTTEIFTNRALDDEDNAFVVAALLAPEPAQAVMSFVAPSTVEFGEQGISDLLARRVRNALGMALASFVVYALHRARRLGRVVDEPLPVRIEASELVLQAGVLSERADDPANAARVIRDDFSARWRKALATNDTDPHALAAAMGRVAPIDIDGLTRALTEPITDDEALVTMVQGLDAADDVASAAVSDRSTQPA